MASRGPASKDSILPAISFTREPAACSTIHIPPLITLIKVSSSKFLIVVSNPLITFGRIHLRVSSNIPRDCISPCIASTAGGVGSPPPRVVLKNCHAPFSACPNKGTKKS